MLERMWEPTLGDEKMPWLTRPRRQKVQLFEGQRKAKTHCFRARKGSDRLKGLQKALLKAFSQDGAPEPQNTRDLGLYSTGYARGRKPSRLGHACFAVVLLGLTLAGP